MGIFFKIKTLFSVVSSDWKKKDFGGPNWAVNKCHSIFLLVPYSLQKTCILQRLVSHGSLGEKNATSFITKSVVLMG